MSQSQLESVQTEADELEAQLARVKRQLAEKTDECEAQAAQVKRQRTEEKEKYEERLLLLAQTAGLFAANQHGCCVSNETCTGPCSSWNVPGLLDIVASLAGAT